MLILSAEDGAADTIAPRLYAAEADLGSVYIIKSVMEGADRRTFNLQHDLALLEAECKRIGDVALIIIDPVSSYLGKTDSHKNAEVRGVLEPIGEFAERMDVSASLTFQKLASVQRQRRCIDLSVQSRLWGLRVLRWQCSKRMGVGSCCTRRTISPLHRVGLHIASRRRLCRALSRRM